MSTNKEKFMELVTEYDTESVKRAKWRIRNWWWLKWYKRLQIRWYILLDKIK